MKIPHKWGCIKHENDGFYIYRYFKGLIFNIEKGLRERSGDVSDIKLIETDTTLDLSQKVEKRNVYDFFCTPTWDVGDFARAAPTQAPIATNYNVGSPSWGDLKAAPLPSAMEVTALGHESS
ncbi:hypothetical protein ES319_A10G084700v1 [Gossypium barbadense]|uniref:Uncharacterized protein n=1 Tax=Gossypium barbadense TaxID=3634 RepID=A0A5J5U1P6_GOSBA|nr:hypothetical protein ES319_A10G084700v1 [Gossypium barbadense]